jgi:hypothetical protein
MVLMDIPRIDVAIAEFARVLAGGGVLVLSITHPCFFSYDWVTDEQGQRTYKVISGYLAPRTKELDFWGKTLHYHRPLSHYFDALSHSGFYVDALKEPGSSAGVQDEAGSRRIPSFAVIRATLKS